MLYFRWLLHAVFDLEHVAPFERAGRNKMRDSLNSQSFGGSGRFEDLLQRLGVGGATDSALGDDAGDEDGHYDVDDDGDEDIDSEDEDAEEKEERKQKKIGGYLADLDLL
jgi:hypothetical protein